LRTYESSRKGFVSYSGSEARGVNLTNRGPSLAILGEIYLRVFGCFRLFPV
jgi:hypothetical protein